MKRILAFLLSFILAMSIFSFGVYAQETDENKNINIAVNLGLLSASAFERSDELITRGEFIDALMKLIGAASSSDSVPLSDVTPKSIYYSSICAAYELGYINGYSDGTFRENEPIMQNDAVRLLVTVVGFGDLIKSGMPVSAAARRADICNFSESAVYNGITVREAAELLVNTGNALTVDVMNIGAGGLDYSFSSTTVLEKYRGIHRLTGIVTANEFTYLNEKNATSEGMVIVGGLTLKAGESDVKELLGYNAVIYYTGDKDSDGGTVISATEEKNRVLKVNADEVVEYTGGELKYKKSGGKTMAVKFPIAEVDVIFNNRLNMNPVKEDFDIESGNIVLIDNNNDGKYDVVKILSYETFVVDSVNKTSGKAYGKWGGGVIDFAADKNISFVSELGDRMDVLELAEWDVLSVAESKDKEVMSVIYNVGIVEGEISSYSIEDDEYVLVIEGKEYKTSGFFAENQGYEVKNGLKGLYYLDVDGRICAANFSSASKHNFGYVMATAPKNTMRSEIEIKLMNEKSEKIVTKFAKRMIFNGKSVKTENYEVASVLSDLAPQLVIYGTDSDGLINYLDTAYTENDGVITDLSDDENYQNSLCMYYDGFSTGTKLQYRYNTKVFGAKIAASNNTLIFEIPAGDSEEENDYWVYSLSEYIEENAQKCMQAYKTNSDSLTAEVLLIRKEETSANTVPNGVGISVVEKVKKVRDEDGNYSYQLTVYTGKKKMEYMTLNDELVENYTLNGEPYSIKAGDIIQFVVDIRGKISNCNLVYSMSKDSMNGANPSTSAFLSRFRVQRAFVYRKYKNNFLTTTTELVPGTIYRESELETLEMRTLDNYAVLWYDKENKTVSVVGQNNLVAFVNSGYSESSKVVIYDRDGDGKTLVIYE